VRAGARGLVIAGMGDGNLGAKALAAAADAVRAGVAIVRSSRTGGGFVERNGEIDDDKHGFIVADELNPQKSRILLLLSIAQGLSTAQIQERFYAY
jgi:L-asparaginase